MYNAVKMGLENITAVHEATGRPLDRLPNIVHVAGKVEEEVVVVVVVVVVVEKAWRCQGLSKSTCPSNAFFNSNGDYIGRGVSCVACRDQWEGISSLQDCKGVTILGQSLTLEMPFSVYP